MIDIISEIIQPIEAIFHSENKEDLKLKNLLDFHEMDFTFYDFCEAEAGGFGPPEPPETNPPCTLHLLNQTLSF